MTDELSPAVAEALQRLLPGERRRRILLFLANHPEIESADFNGSIQFDIKDIRHVVPFIRRNFTVIRVEEELLTS